MSCDTTTAADLYYCPEGFCQHPTTGGSCPGHIVQRSCPGFPRSSRATNGSTAKYLTAAGDPVLARIWDNEDDAVYDEMGNP